MPKVNGLSIANILSDFETGYNSFLLKDKQIDEFRHGDRVSVHIKSATSKRLSVVSGVCIASGGSGLKRYFVVLKVTDGVSVTIKYFMANPNIHSIKLEKRAKKYKRAKLYYMVRKNSEKC